MNSSTSASDGARTQWRRWLLTFLLSFVGFAAVLEPFVVLCDPYSTGRFTPFRGVDIAIAKRVLANAGRVREEAFDSAIIGNSHATRLQPELLDPLSGRRFVQLAVPGLGPFDQIATADAFVQAHGDKAKAIVFILDYFWCELDARRMKRYPDFPYWLYGTDTTAYLANLLSIDALQASAHRLAIRYADAPEPARKDGYAANEQRGEWAPDRAATLAKASRLVDAPSEVAVFSGLEALDAFSKRLSQSTELVLVFPPFYVSQIPVQGSPAERWLQACFDRVQSVANLRPHSAMLNLRREDSTAADANNFWDATHARDFIVRKMEKAIAAELLVKHPWRRPPAMRDRAT